MRSQRVEVGLASLDQLRLMRRRGELVSWRMCQSADGQAWFLAFYGNGPTPIWIASSRAPNEPRRLVTFEAGLTLVAQVGFNVDVIAGG